jgi:predicted oxidoreductase
MSVQVSKSSIVGGTAGSVFSNDGGLFRINQLNMTDTTAASLIATANNGASFLDESTISGKFVVVPGSYI